MSYLPSSGARWWSAFVMTLGGLVGWLTHPVIWLVAGPFRWIALLNMTAAQESGWNAEAVGDSTSKYGNSVGMLQFNTSRWPSLTGRDLEDRTSPFLSGYYGAVYVQLALLTSWSWWSLGLPLYGAAVMRYMWTHGVSASAAEKASEEAWDIFLQEGKSYGAFLTIRGLTLLPAVVSVWALYVFARRALKLRRVRGLPSGGR